MKTSVHGGFYQQTEVNMDALFNIRRRLLMPRILTVTSTINAGHVIEERLLQYIPMFNSETR